MSKNVSSTAVVIGALRGKSQYFLDTILAPYKYDILSFNINLLCVFLNKIHTIILLYVDLFCVNGISKIHLAFVFL